MYENINIKNNGSTDKIRSNIIDTSTISKLTDNELIELEGLLLQDLYARAREDFWTFCNYWDEPFFNERPFLKDVADKMQSITLGQTRRLAISMPPRAGKSYIASLFSAWTLGRNPEGSVMRNSCTTTLARKFSYDVREIVKDKKFKQIFKDVNLSSDKTAVDGWNLQDSRQVGYFCGGVGSTIVGFGADNLSILDDPIKDVEEALSEHVLEKKWDWYTGVHRSRLEKNCPEIHIATRWSRRDIIGRMEALGEFDDMIVVPALDGDDRSFCEDVKSTSDYQRIREITAPFIWNAEYMQSPVEVTGLLYPRDQLQTFDISTLRDEGENIAVVDVADKGNDFLACGVLKLVGDTAYLIDVVFTQDPIEITEGLVASALISNNVTLCRIESNSGGRSFARNVETILRDNKFTTAIEQKPTTKNKQTRMMIRSGIVREFVRFRDDENMNTHYKQFMQQLCSTFKDVAKNKHDDAADCITMGAELIESKTLNNWVI